MPRRLSNETAAVLELFVLDPRREAFGRQIIQEIGIPSGVLYPILHRLEERGYLVSDWEALETAVEHRRRPRRIYRLDPRGAEPAAAALAAARPGSAARQSFAPRPYTA